jgi:hypothetical protein
MFWELFMQVLVENILAGILCKNSITTLFTLSVLWSMVEKWARQPQTMKLLYKWEPVLSTAQRNWWVKPPRLMTWSNISHSVGTCGLGLKMIKVCLNTSCSNFVATLFTRHYADGLFPLLIHQGSCLPPHLQTHHQKLKDRITAAIATVIPDMLQKV